MTDAIYALVKDLMTRAEFEARVTTRQEAVGSLLNREAIAHLIADELGVLPRETMAQAIARSAPAAIVGKVVEVSATRTFRRADGSVGFVADVTVLTDTGPERIVCWDEAVRRAASLQLGTRVRVEGVSARTRMGKSEWHSGRGFSMQSEKE